MDEGSPNLGSPAVGPEPEEVRAPAGNIPRTRFWGKLGSPTVATVVAVVAAAIAFLSATASILQEKSAEQHNSIVQHQQLMSLVADIARKPVDLQQARTNYKDDEEVLDDTVASIGLTGFAQAEEAAGIIQSLHDQSVTSAEYYIVAVALENNSDYAISLQFLDSAAARSMDVRGHVDALRESAKLLYLLGGQENIHAAEGKIADAKAVIARAVLMTDDTRKSVLAYTYLFDAKFQAKINCEKAKEEFRAAQKMVTDTPDASTPGIRAKFKTNSATHRSMPTIDDRRRWHWEFIV